MSCTRTVPGPSPPATSPLLSDHRIVDRAGDAIPDDLPGFAAAARVQRRFPVRAVRFLACDAGIRRLSDIGPSGSWPNSWMLCHGAATGPRATARPPMNNFPEFSAF
ncbi:SAM-dependent methyltransferase [Streptomyces sp. NPDC087226]|uniref:SAM-dependent methyltransferase n=1 Tax=Streptomyces sp. NPDC087226 TaxID=3365771 RepID=UPI0037F34CE2